MALLDNMINSMIAFHGVQVANTFKADVFSYLGAIQPDYLPMFRSEIEGLAEAARPEKPDNLVFLLHTGGGVVETVEKMVEVIRYHYKEIWFVVPDLAMSAGTILCMAGDKIYMDYSSALGPIDPQVRNKDGSYVPALGYLDQVEDLLDKSNRQVMTDAEFAVFQNLDFAELKRYEQAKNLSTSLLKEWLAKYKFKDWEKHSSDNRPVTEEDKETRAQEIATQLNDHKHWHSHGRMIGIDTLRDSIKLKIEDYSTDKDIKSTVRNYSDLLLDCAKARQLPYLFHSAQYNK